MKKRIFITGISTGVGKTIAAAILAEALEADYWKPIQTGDLEQSDAHTIQKLISNSKTIIHPSQYILRTPMSPHAAAYIEGVTINLEKIKEPVTSNHLIIEGAGGVLVPLNDTHTIANLIQPHYKVVVVSRHYLGSINHTLLTTQFLKTRELNIALIFNGSDPASYSSQSTEDIITHITGISVMGRVENEPYWDKTVVREYAALFREELLKTEII